MKPLHELRPCIVQELDLCLIGHKRIEFLSYILIGYMIWKLTSGAILDSCGDGYEQ